MGDTMIEVLPKSPKKESAVEARPLHELDDSALVARFLEGEKRAFTELVDRYHVRLLNFIYRTIGDRDRAEDLVQETFISFLKAVAGFREEASIETYLFTILRRKMIDLARGRHASICLLQDVLVAGDEDAGDAAQAIASLDPTASWYARRDEQHHLQRDALTRVMRTIIDGYKAALNFRDLQIVEMIFYAQGRNRDVAEAVGVNEKAVAVIKHRCLRRIRELLEPSPGLADADPPDALLSEIWQGERLSCLKRSTIGAYMLGTLESPWQEYVAFHLERLGCRFCRANLDDLQAQTADDTRHKLRERIFESTVGFLRKQ